MTNINPEYPKRYKIIWKQNLTKTELEILLEEWQGYFEVEKI